MSTLKSVIQRLGVKLRRHRRVLLFLSVLPLSLTLLCICVQIYVTYNYFFVRRNSEVDVVLEEAKDYWHFGMNSESCVNDILSPKREFVQFRVSKPYLPEYSVQATTLPISITLAFKEGYLSFQGWELEASEVWTNTVVITRTPRLFRLEAEQLDVDLEDFKNIELSENVCASYLLYGSDRGTLGLYNTESLLSRDDSASVFTEHQFIEPGQTITITLLGNVATVGRTLEKISFTFSSGSRYFESYSLIGTYGQRLSFQLPDYGATAIAGSNVALEQARVSEIRIRSPVGKMVLEYEGIIELEPPIGPLDRRELRLGGPDSSDSSFLVFPKENEEKGHRDYQISGSTSSVMWRGNQLIKARWQLISPDVQAAIIGAALSACGYLLLRIGSRFYKQKAKSNDFEQEEILPGQRVSVPPGHFVLILTSGRALAGQVKKKPGLLNRRYVLADVMFRDIEGVWQDKTMSEVSVEASKVEYTYVAGENS